MIIIFTRCLACIGVLSLAVHADLFNLQDYSKFTSLVHDHNAAVFNAVPPPVYTGSGEPPPRPASPY